MPFFIKLMLKYHVLDRSGGRKIHKGEKVNVGGAIIFIAFLASYLIALPFITKQEPIDLAITFIILILCIVVVGIRDDMNSLTAKNKLIIEIILVLFLCRMGIRIDNLYGFWGIYEIPPWVSYSLTVFFFIVVLNTYNLIDGIDGQAATQALAVLVPLLLFFLFIVPGNECKNCFGGVFFWSIICVSIIGALLGFIHYNWEPSRVFMGDAGSISIGVLLASVMIAAIQYNGVYGNDITINCCEIKSKIGVIVVLFFVPLADTLRVFISRIMRGKSPFTPDKSHIHHFLLRTGASHQTSTLTTLSFSIIISIVGIVLSTIFYDNIFIPLLAVLFILYVLSLSYVTKLRIKKMKKNRLCQKKLNQ
jgi:UDP-GlcNAc:undecaprenyl-phosphate/decaprenyl-phosphate GlcNAc-1-phosphate transferase